MVAALQALLLILQDDFLAAGDELVVLDVEACEGLAVKAYRGVDEVDPAILGEFRIKRESEETIFLCLKNLHLRNERHALGLRVVDFKRPGVFVKPDAAIGSELEVHRLREAGQQGLRLEADVFGRSLRRADGWAQCQHGGTEEGKEADRR